MKKQYDISSTSTVINVSFYESRINEFGENIYVETIPIFESIIPKHEVKQISESLPSMHKDKEFYEFLKRFFMDLINRGYQPKFRFSQEIDISYSDEIYEEKNGYNLIKNGYTISTKTEEISSDYKSRIGIIMPKPSIGHIEKIAISEITIES